LLYYSQAGFARSLPDIFISANNDPINYNGADANFVAFWVGHYLTEQQQHSSTHRQLLPNHNVKVNTVATG
jgi:hypothetical protein